MKSHCNCISYNRPASNQSAPSVILDPNEYFKWDSPAGTVCVDACIAEDIKALWRAQIWTQGCCCGHNERKSNVVLANAGDSERAREILGQDWEILAWVLTPLAEPQTPKIQKRTKP